MLLALFHFPSAFNSSLVLPPCFQRRLAVLVSFSSLAASSGVSLLLAFAFDRVTQTGPVLSLVWTGWLSAQCRKPLMKKSGAGEGNRTLCTIKTPMDNGLRLCKSQCLSPYLNESHTVSVNGLVSVSFLFSFQFFSCLGFMLAEEVSCLLPARRSDPLSPVKRNENCRSYWFGALLTNTAAINVVFVVKKSPEQIYAFNETKSVSLAFLLGPVL